MWFDSWDKGVLPYVVVTSGSPTFALSRSSFCAIEHWLITLLWQPVAGKDMHETFFLTVDGCIGL